MEEYINIIRQYKIVHHSVNITYDNATQRKVCYPPPAWQKLTFERSCFKPFMNSIIQLTGTPSNIIAIDIDGLNNPINQLLNTLCQETCLFYNKTRKGYHYIYQYTDLLPSTNYKYPNDPECAGLDIQSNGKCIYYGSYKMGSTIVKYENIKHEAIVPIPDSIINFINNLPSTGDTSSSNDKPLLKQKGKIIKKNPNIQPVVRITSNEFPCHTRLSCETIEKLISCVNQSYFINYNLWIEICFIIKQLNHTDESFNIFAKYSRAIPQFSQVPDSVFRTKWNSIKYHPDFNPEGIFHMARRDNPTLFNTITIKLAEFGSSDNLPTTKFNHQYLNYEELSNHIQNNYITAIKSPYGTGKTTFISKLVNSPNFKNKRIIFITARITLSYSLLSAFPTFRHYHHCSSEELLQQDRLIIQLDSIHKIQQFINNELIKQVQAQQQASIIKLTNTADITQYLENPDCDTNLAIINTTNQYSQCTKYDIIILDEIESLLAHLAFEKMDSPYIFNTLSQLCNYANKVIAMDGDLGIRSFDFLNGLTNTQDTNTNVIHPTQGTRKMTILENTHQTPSKHFLFSNDYNKFIEDIENDLTNSKNIVIACMSVKISELLYKTFKDKYKTIIHNSIQNDKEGIKDINTYWTTAQLVIYTSTIEAGCDFNRQWFHKCYIILSNKSTTPRALMQMINRVRHYKLNEYSVYTNSIPFLEFQLPYTFDEVKLNLFKRFIRPDGTLSHYDTVMCHNHLENLNRQYFITILCSILRSKGHTYTYLADRGKSKPDRQNTIYDDIAGAVDLANDNAYQKAINNIHNTKISGKEQRELYFSIKKYLFCKIWNFKPDEVDSELITKYYPKATALFNYKLLCKYIENPAFTNSYSSTYIIHNKIRLIKSVLLQFNITHQTDFDYSIECGTTEAGRKRNRLSNPAIMNKDTFTSIMALVKSTITSHDYKQTFQLPKIKGVPSERQILEWLKTGLKCFGMDLVVIRKSYRNDENKFCITCKYLIDLNEELIDLLYRKTHGDLDILIENINENNAAIILDF
jgi:hypothetical protein